MAIDGQVLGRSGRPGRRENCLEELRAAVNQLGRLDDVQGVGSIYDNLVPNASRAGEVWDALAAFEKAGALAEEAGLGQLGALALANLAEGELDAAARHATDSLDFARWEGKSSFRAW